MRWDRLFADLEAEVQDIEKAEIDGLAVDLNDEIWAATSWRELLGGQILLDVAGLGQISGHVAAVNEHLLRVRSHVVDHLVACSAVTSVLSSERRTDTPGRIEAAMRWPQALRRLREAGESVRMVMSDGRAFDGQIDVVGADFVRLSQGSDASRLISLDAVAVVTSGR